MTAIVVTIAVTIAAVIYLGIGQLIVVRAYHEVVKKGRDPSNILVLVGSAFILAAWPALFFLPKGKP